MPCLKMRSSPLYYNTSLDGVPDGWVKMMIESIRSIAHVFSSRRMVKEYVRRYYPSLLKCAETGFETCPV